MIPAIAGFPKGTSQTVGTVTVDSNTRRYNAYSWVSAPGAVGSTNPANISVVPGKGSDPGGVGEVLSIQGSDLVIYVRGPGSTGTSPGSFSSLASVPFTTVVIDGVTFNKADATLVSGYQVQWPGKANPLMSGTTLTRSIKFT